MKKLALALCGFYILCLGTAYSQSNQKLDIALNLAGSIPDSSGINQVTPSFNGYNVLHKLRLDSLQKIIPLDYNEEVLSYINSLSRQKDRMGKMLALSDYYFPIFEKALKAYEVPLEVKYLPIIESSMDPHAVSRVGATGIWQFMFATAKGYGLNIDNFVDERKDPIQASYAAAAYLKDAYEEFGDWLLALAAYNCGKGNVNKAITRAGSKDFWEIKPYLPKETRNYIPAFIAAVYVMNYANLHDIPKGATVLTGETDTLQVNRFVSLSEVAKAINYEEELLYALNPSYKKKIVNGTTSSPKRLVLPNVNQNYYVQLYDVLNADLAVDRKIILASTDDVRELKKGKEISKTAVVYHRVNPGQNLSTIANRYQVEVQDLKVWNNLKGSQIIVGQKLKIQQAKPSYITYTVKPGDTLSGIAEKFDGATVSGIKKTNGLTKANIQPGMLLKIIKG